MVNGAKLRPPPRRPSSPALWGALIALSVPAGAGLHEIGLPAAFLLGPLMAAILVQTTGGGVKIPLMLQAGAQAVIGCLIARAVTPAVVTGFLQHWAPVIATVMLSLTGSVLIGWGMSRLRIIPGTTPVWGMMPGAATTMMVMAEAYGADARLVAFMQYLRVVLVAAAGSVVAILFAHGGGSRVTPGYFPPIDLQSLATTLALASIGASAGLVRESRPACSSVLWCSARLSVEQAGFGSNCRRFCWSRAMRSSAGPSARASPGMCSRRQ